MGYQRDRVCKREKECAIEKRREREIENESDDFGWDMIEVEGVEERKREGKVCLERERERNRQKEILVRKLKD